MGAHSHDVIISRSRPPPRRELALRGPRPCPLKVRENDSHKINLLPPAETRQPVIIYTVSPKVIHASRSEFMSLVQRLTGAPSSSNSGTGGGGGGGGAPSTSPAARAHELRKSNELVGGLDELQVNDASLFPAAGVSYAVPSSAVGHRQHHFFDEINPSCHELCR